MPVSMGDSWFEIAVPEHFWMIRRFEVLRSLADNIITSAQRPAEIGCGNGALQAQIETHYRRTVDGFDLNQLALEMSVAKSSDRFCYNILERKAELKHRFDLIFLFDIIEHIDDEDGFMQAVLHHLAPGGHLIINVPALPWLFSAYDRAAGHVRRYTVPSLGAVASRNQLSVEKLSYWGLPMVPLLLVRKLMLALRKQSDHDILHQGFKPPSAGWNRLLGMLARVELLPQTLLGSSVMAVLRKPTES